MHSINLTFLFYELSVWFCKFEVNKIQTKIVVIKDKGAREKLVSMKSTIIVNKSGKLTS